jgi:hypothetical protein
MKTFTDYLNESSNFLTEGFVKLTKDLTREQFDMFQKNMSTQITKRGEVTTDFISKIEEAIYANLMLFKFNYQASSKPSPWDTDQFKLIYFKPAFKNGSIHSISEGFLDDVGILNTKIFIPITYSMKYEFSGRTLIKDFINNFWISILNFDPNIVKQRGKPKYTIGVNESNRLNYGLEYWREDFPLDELKMLTNKSIWRSIITNVLGPRFGKTLRQLSSELKLKVPFTPYLPV